ncbi:bis(5'-nucleosyl)-tetraphosphatase (symmetrical) YqeK [Lysinibacillus odysseyi]|uniref:bis(5'-nucleosyl)-tetraphosphatase (symmetrical) n=1 Tax=Lysinibacillus odysseyi 34hs-1 = NBRC 100172 TaxID=1220589 RepID=A0A0A3IKZ5_9BACI|nr:bis(5'-nucleosyl)-tetraphosphatase (symmetrical) YqeK [Lysinibacillus odysseyi]KGR83498.1 phosphohydrolase [Lysinibacillus odysseyi 34hs-1 = NBRC 100172]
MEREALLEYIRPRMPEKRYIHTIGVMETAILLAEKYGVDTKKAEIAAILHDMAKYEEVEGMRAIVREQGLDTRLLPWGSEILHGPIAAYRAEFELGIKDEAILNAMRYHTTGRAGMSRLEQIIYIADMIEPNRKFPGVEPLRQIAEEDLQKAMKACIHHSILFLVTAELPIYPLSIECYNDYLGEEL